ncbi:MAG: methyltransferase domain-containing protein [Solirubrobacterales bacterium]|nr:methyltransferase domain-containing protein [Solirubrobacterales bacterium]
MDQVDVRKIQYKDESFDAVICNHVLNVIDDDRAAMRELHRVVKTGGWALLQSSMDLTQEHTAEKENAWDPAGAAGRYEEVFMRWYGRDYATLLEQAGFTVTESDFVKDLPAATKRELGLDPEETIFFCRKLGVPEAGSGSEVRPGQAMSDHIVARHHEAK